MFLELTSTTGQSIFVNVQAIHYMTRVNGKTKIDIGDKSIYVNEDMKVISDQAGKGMKVRTDWAPSPSY